MGISNVLNGTLIAGDVHSPSEIDTAEFKAVSTVAELLDKLRENPPTEFAILKTTCARLVGFLGKGTDQMPIDLVNDAKDGFRAYLAERRYKENSIRTYVNHVTILLRHAEDCGWKPGESVPEVWRSIMAYDTAANCPNALRHFARRSPDPASISSENVDEWADDAVKKGLNYRRMRNERTTFLRLLHKCGCLQQMPVFLLQRKGRSVKLCDLPPEFRQELLDLLNWKQAELSMGRPKGSQIRPVTAKQIRTIVQQLYFFATRVAGRIGILSLAHLMDKELISSYLEWCVNERKVAGLGLQHEVRLLFASIRQYPAFRSLDVSWWRMLHDSIPIEPESERRRRKAMKYLEYETLESIPSQIRAHASQTRGLSAKETAREVMNELMMRWLLVLPWRQRNIRECRIGGQKPNLFRGKIPPFSEIDKPLWVRQEEERNPQALFWQFEFSPDETKTKRRVQALVPRPLIPLLEEYLRLHRPQLLTHSDPGTLFINEEGNALNSSQVADIVCALTLRNGGRRVTPHLFRDIVAFTWLKHHPKDYLTLSKILWHSNINTTINTYGSRFNESSGVCAMEEWLEDREKRSKLK